MSEDLLLPVSMNHTLRCTVCSRVLNTAVTIACGHSFCSECILKLWERGRRNECPCSCPECSYTFPSRPQLITDTTLAEQVRDWGSAGDGKRQRQRQQHESRGKSPQKQPESGRKSPQKQPESGRKSPQKRAFRDAASGDARCHIGCVGEERRRKEEELRNIQETNKEILQKQKRKCGNLKNVLTQIEEEAGQVADYCEGVLVGVMASIQKHYLSVRELIGVQEKAVADQVSNSVQTLEEKIKEMEKRDAELERLALSDSDTHFLQEWPELQRLCEVDRVQVRSELSEDPLLPFEFTKRAVQEVGVRLEEFCKKEFASVTESDSEVEQELTGDTEEDVTVQRCGSSDSPRGMTSSLVPTTRAEFLQYACDLTFDPTTAHEDLVVSVGDKEVKWRSTDSRKSLPTFRHPQRFTCRRQLLCREALQAEHCYYEIEVEGNKVEIALAYKGMYRKSNTPRSAFGANKHSWSLDRSSSYSVSHNRNSVELTKCPQHQRIGVYLKFKEGTVSFYEVSDSMIYLYKTEANFTEPLYPGFWLDDKCCIRICDLSQDI
ncbi:tripartite motif-containing protein 16-like protein isoform X2 [Solea solea]|uniref:tripartite motif-containing protein 16-like protein isoform X2 n=1 Tax=Solea solea TaxID=90069 RepID=UPI00272B133A|nr:tripartite motif-containing protein 16-like protein isoform X2 [Solea solea]